MIPCSDFTGAPVDLHQARRQAQVSDHALVRYMERVMGVPVEQIRAAMLSDTVLQAMALDATSVHGDGFKAVIDNFVMITVLPSDSLGIMAPARRRRSGR